MKLYEKIINGKYHCKPKSKIVLIKDGKQIINPSEEMLLEDGWKVHEPIKYEPTEEEILNMEKEHKIEEILRYDSSKEVNGFYVGDIWMWLDKLKRVGLKFRFEAEIASGRTDTTLWDEGIPFPMTLENALSMLNAIELYASACYDNTQKHIAMIKLLTTIDEVKNYDYREGYPEKLRF